ncbi:hypothetical protein [Parvularcula sp. IMCC14364]|uniref:hypothetical protein n=1 Tax=Parvularcula sp. IMCC14364 TaxID=3067902 RepID=UPI002740410B|nr:hypothetical protein [Parvularcula sp. IMCC14364]
MDEKNLIKRLHDFERKVYLGVTGLAGAGAVAVVTKWQTAWAEMSEAGETFGEMTATQGATASAYENVAVALDNLRDTVATGSKDAIHQAGETFYVVLAENHARLWEILPENVRGAETEDEPPLRAIEILGRALGLN